MAHILWFSAFSEWQTQISFQTFSVSEKLIIDKSNLLLTLSRLRGQVRNEQQSDPVQNNLVKGCQESEPALISDFFHFCFTWAKWNTIGQKVRKARKPLVYLYLIRSNENPHGVIYIWSQRIRVECACYWCFSKFSAYIWLNFKLAKEGTGNTCSSWKYMYVNESRHTCRVADCIII